MPDSALIVEVLFWVAFVYSIILHEIAHGWVAKRAGDYTAEMAGRLSFNPLRHIDPMMTIAMPIITAVTMGVPFGGAKPVPVNPYNFRNLEWDDFKVSIAGVSVNFLIAAACAGTLHIWEPGTINYALFGRIAIMNLVLGIFNLIPIPPLDGSHVMRHILSRIDPGIAEAYERIGFFGIIIIIFAMRFLRPIMWSVIDFVWTHIFMLHGVAAM